MPNAAGPAISQRFAILPRCHADLLAEGSGQVSLACKPGFERHLGNRCPACGQKIAGSADRRLRMNCCGEAPVMR
jgi:hypothetical protein